MKKIICLLILVLLFGCDLKEYQKTEEESKIAKIKNSKTCIDGVLYYNAALWDGHGTRIFAPVYDRYKQVVLCDDEKE